MARGAYLHYKNYLEDKKKNGEGELSIAEQQKQLKEYKKI